MADSKITALASISTATDPAVDPLVIVDVSDTSMAASGTSKKVTLNNLLSSSPTATGAFTVSGLVTAGSTTITGAATVGTTLGVTGVSTFAAGTALLPALTTTGDTNTGIYYPAADTFAVTTGGTERYRVDSSGNVGVGVTPSAWDTAVFKVIQIGTGVGQATVASRTDNVNNTAYGLNYYYGTGDYRYIAAGRATNYEQAAGKHLWNIDSGTQVIGAATSFTQAMTLDASGNLLVGTVTSPTGTKIGAIAKLGKVSVEGSNSITVTTAATPLAKAFDTGGLFFVSGYNNVGGSRGWFLVAAGGVTPTVIASDNLTGLTVAFTSPSGVLNMNTTSGSLTVTSISLTNQGV